MLLRTGPSGKCCGDLHFGAVVGIDELLGEGRQVVLGIGDLDVGDQLGTLADEVIAPAEQVAGFAHAFGVDVGRGDVAAAEESADLLGIDVIVLGLAAVDGPHVERVAEDEGDLVFPAEVADPVPGEEALDTDDDVGAEGGECIEEDLLVGRNLRLADDLPGTVEDADGQEPGMEIDAGVELVLFGVEVHGASPDG